MDRQIGSYKKTTMPCILHSNRKAKYWECKERYSAEEVLFTSLELGKVFNFAGVFKETQSTVMLCALKCFDCFVFRHFISHFSDDRLISKAYAYQSALFLDDAYVIFFIVGIC